MTTLGARSRMMTITLITMSTALVPAAECCADPQHDYQRATFAAEDRLTSGRFKGVREISREPEARTPADLDRMGAEYAARLRDEIRAGRHVLEPATSAELIQRFGTDQYARLQGAPGFRTLLDKYIESKANWYRHTELAYEYTQLRRHEEYDLLIDEHGNSRVDKNVLFATENGIEDPEYNRNNSMTLVITDEQVMQRVRSTSPQAVVFNGLFGDPIAHDKWLCGFDPRSSGRPTVLAERRWSDRDLQSSTPIMTPEGAAIELRFSRQAGTNSEVLVLVLLDQKDSLIAEQREYTNHRLSHSVVYGDYRKLNDGRWYPFQRAAQYVRTKEIDGSVLAGIRSGQILPWSNEALRAAGAASVTFRMSDTFRTSLAEPDVPTAETDFTLELETGTVVYDTRKLDRLGQPLRSVVSGQVPAPQPAADPAITTMIDAATPILAKRAVKKNEIHLDSTAHTEPVLTEQSNTPWAGWTWIAGGSVFTAAAWLIVRQMSMGRR